MKKGARKIAVLFLLIGWYVYVLFISVPSISFYFDNKSTEADILKVSKSKVQLKYHHSDKLEEYHLEKKLEYVKHYNKLKETTSWPITYSTRFPTKISMHRIDPKPGLLPSFLLLGVSVIPLIFFKNLKFN